MKIDNVLFFDTETTGVPERSANWDTDFDKFPHIVQMAWMHGCKVESHIIRPEGWEIPQETVEIHGITTEYALEHGEPFAVVADMFIQDCHEAELVCAHNIYFDTSIIKANILRELGREYYDANGVENALWKGKRIDTMRSTMKWVDARRADGRLKFPNLSELYSRCFPGETFPAHNALEDVKAIAKCLPVILDLGLIELKVKEYQEQATDPGTAVVKMAGLVADVAKIATDVANKLGASPERPENGPILDRSEKDDKLPIQQEKAPQNGNSAKITGIAAELLDANEF